MSELEDKLNSLLSNQDAMAQVMQLAQSLSQSCLLYTSDAADEL